MTPEQRKLISDYLYGHADALRLCEDILFCAHLWDDQIDRDKPRTDYDIHQGWWRALIQIPENPFYRAHIDRLLPVMRMAITDWHTSIEFERDKSACLDKLATAFVIRSSYLNVIIACGTIIGGDEYGLRTAGLIREQFHSEGLRKYRDRLRVEARERDGNV